MTRPLFRPLLFLLAATLLSPAPAQASDHVDGATVMVVPSSDLNDLFIFPKPGDPDRLILILDAFAGAANGTAPDPDYAFEFVLRGARKAPDAARFETSGDYRITCQANATQQITCTSSTGTTAQTGWNDQTSPTPDAPLNLFAGHRSDPFFLNGGWAAKVTNGLEITPPSDSNSIRLLNAFSFVLDVSIPQELGGLDGPLYALAAQVTDTSTGAIYDWMGRAEITNVALQLGDPDVRDAYNALGAFPTDTAARAKFLDRLTKNIGVYNTLADPDVTAQAQAALAALFVDDFLIVDTSKPCREAFNYLSIEHAALTGQPHESCGGRLPNDDIIDAIYSMLITGQLDPPIRDGADQATVPASDSFPYLAPPNEGLAARAKGYLGRALSLMTAPGAPRRTGILMLAIAALPLVILLIGLVKYVRYRRGGGSGLGGFFAAHWLFTLIGVVGIVYGLMAVFG